MPLPKTSARITAKPVVADLAPMLNQLIQSEIQKVLAGLGESIAEQVRSQIVAALTLPGTAPAASRRPVAAKVATSATAPKTARAVTRGRAKRGGARRPAGAAPEASECNVNGCVRPHRSKGYCAAHYQSARKYGWPTPCPAGFEAPVLKRGRPAKAAGAAKLAAATK